MSRWQKFLLIALLCFGGARAFAASKTEEREFSVAATAFDLHSWAYAETNFARFIEKYPNSDLLSEAILRRAQARFHLHDYDGAISLLATNEAKSGWRADQYAYWIGESQLAGENFSAAADSFERVIQNFPVSTNRLAASVREAEARTHLQQWPRVTELLQNKDGAFQQAIRAGATNDLVATGYLLLGEAQLVQRNFGDADNTLTLLAPLNLNPTLAWRRGYLKCRVQLAEGKFQELAGSTTNLLARADAAKDLRFTAESVALRAEVLERLGKLDEAISAYKKNLMPEVPADRQREAALKIAELSLALTNISDAVRTLGNFLSQNTNAASTDVALLTLGELQLKQFLSDTNATAILTNATAGFDRLLNEFPNSPLVGKAWLDKGWCLWLQKNYADSEVAFQKAALRLPPVSDDQAVARFKWADAQFERGNFAGAITNYNYIVTVCAALPKVKREWLEQALYQIVRAALETGDFDSATNALEKILAGYPQGFAGGRELGAAALLLTGEQFELHADPARARALFSRFEELYPTNSLAQEVRLAIARSFERERNWDAAITNYDACLAVVTNSSYLAAAQFGRAWDNYMAGRDATAFTQFTNFVSQFPTNPLTLQARWWIGDYCFRSNDWIGAETAYQLVFRNTNWPPSDVSYEAEMMAGRAAMARQGYNSATNYFSNLADDTNCPLDLRLQASFACGDALMSRSDPDATNHDADLTEAVKWFSSISKKYPTDALAPLAWGRVGDCYLQLAASGTNFFYDLASNAYQQVLDLPQASLSARCQAKVGLGIVAEKLAKQKTADEQSALYQQALNDYQDVFLGNNLKEGEQRDLVWVKEAGLKAFRVASENLGDWRLAFNICTNVADSVPQLRAIFETKLARAREHLTDEKK